MLCAFKEKTVRRRELKLNQYFTRIGHYIPPRRRPASVSNSAANCSQVKNLGGTSTGSILPEMVSDSFLSEILRLDGVCQMMSGRHVEKPAGKVFGGCSLLLRWHKFL